MREKSLSSQIKQNIMMIFRLKYLKLSIKFFFKVAIQHFSKTDL